MKTIETILKMIAIAAIFAFGMTACQDATLSPYPVDDYRPPYRFQVYPLEVSNYWSYDVISYNNQLIDQYTLTINNKYDFAIEDTTVECFIYNQRYQNNTTNSGENGRMYYYKNKLISTLNLNNYSDKSQQVVIADYPLDLGKFWENELYRNLPGMRPIVEIREVIRKMDTTYSYFQFINCAEISRKWIYDNGIRKDTVYIGKYILCPQVGLIYDEVAINGTVYEKTILQDYAFKIPTSNK